MSDIGIKKCPKCGKTAIVEPIMDGIFRIKCWQCGEFYINEKGEDMSQKVADEAMKRREW